MFFWIKARNSRMAEHKALQARLAEKKAAAAATAASSRTPQPSAGESDTPQRWRRPSMVDLTAKNIFVEAGPTSNGTKSL